MLAMFAATVGKLLAVKAFYGIDWQPCSQCHADLVKLFGSKMRCHAFVAVRAERSHAL